MFWLFDLNPYAYVFAGVFVATLFWLVTRRGWDPRKSGSVWGWLARRVLLTVVIALAWPAVLIMMALYAIPATRPWFIRLLLGPKGERDGG